MQPGITSKLTRPLAQNSLKNPSFVINATVTLGTKLAKLPSAKTEWSEKEPRTGADAAHAWEEAIAYAVSI